jgi:hypothetical protein
MKDDIDDVFGGSKASGYIRLMLAKKKGMKPKDYAPEKKAREKKSKKYQVCKQDKFSGNVLERFANKKLKENTNYPTEQEQWLYQRGPNYYRRGPDRKPEHIGNVMMPNEYHPDECKKDSTLEKKEQREAEKKAKKQEKEASKSTPEQKKAMKKEYDAQRYQKIKEAKAKVEGKGKSMDRKGLCCKECKDDKVCMSKKAYLSEHDRLIKMLADKDRKGLKGGSEEEQAFEASLQQSQPAPAYVEPEEESEGEDPSASVPKGKKQRETFARSLQRLLFDYLKEVAGDDMPDMKVKDTSKILSELPTANKKKIVKDWIAELLPSGIDRVKLSEGLALLKRKIPAYGTLFDIYIKKYRARNPESTDSEGFESASGEGKFRGGVLSEEKKRQLAEERKAYAKNMRENPEKYVAKSFDPSEGGTKEPCWYRPALEKGGLTFKHRISAGYQTPEDCQRIQQAQIDEGQRRMLENESGVNKFFRKVVGGLTKVADFATNLPFVPTIAKEAYKAFAPPTSEFYSGNGKRRFITKIKTMKGAGMKPEEKTFFITAEQTYEDNPPKQVGDFLLIGNSPTIDAWLNYKTNTIMIAVRGTKDFRDVKADISLPFNNLINTQRYKTDKMIVGSLAKTFNPSVYDYYLTGHSLGGAIVAQLKRDFPFLKDAVLYNSAFQPKDLVQQSSNTIKRNYTSDDPLYQAGGKLFIGANVLPMSSSDVDGVLGKVIKGYKGHKISKFRELYSV